MCLLQTAEQITAIVEEARKSPHGVADWDNDEYLDGALNQEDYGGGSYDEWGMLLWMVKLRSAIGSLCSS